MIAGSCTPDPSSVKIFTPLRAMSASGANATPARPTVMQPLGATSTKPARRPCARTNSMMGMESCAGVVFGIATSAVYPPFAPARLPVSIVSESSLPGSRKCVCRSTKPGSTWQPTALSTTSSADAVMVIAISAITPPSMRTSSRCSPLSVSTVAPEIITLTQHLLPSTNSIPHLVQAHQRAQPYAPTHRWLLACESTSSASPLGQHAFRLLYSLGRDA